jgi:hypothetical protein
MYASLHVSHIDIVPKNLSQVRIPVASCAFGQVLYFSYINFFTTKGFPFGKHVIYLPYARKFCHSF